MQPSIKIVNLNQGYMAVLCIVFATLMKLFENEKLKVKEVTNSTTVQGGGKQEGQLHISIYSLMFSFQSPK